MDQISDFSVEIVQSKEKKNIITASTITQTYMYFIFTGTITSHQGNTRTYTQQMSAEMVISDTKEWTW